ncbi:MAG: hypothetical protein M3P51_13455 [Chloroflexota bacterium]|nr:hypothetical protein [Chloroflexota bacterium]
MTHNLSPDSLLNELESLPHDARLHRMVEVGRLSVTDGFVASTLDALERLGFYERRLAVASCYGSRAGARVLWALGDPSRNIRALALSLVPLACDDEQVLEAFDHLRWDCHKPLLRRLYKARRQAPIDAHLERLAERRVQHLGTLLPFGSASVVTSHIGGVLDHMDQHEWRRLARLHPEVAADSLSARAEVASSLDPRLVWQATAALPVLARLVPDRALALVHLLTRHAPLSGLPLQELAQRRPEELARIVLGSEDRPAVRFDILADRLDPATLLSVAERRADTLRGSRWLECSRRGSGDGCTRRSSAAGADPTTPWITKW